MSSFWPAAASNVDIRVTQGESRDKPVEASCNPASSYLYAGRSSRCRKAAGPSIQLIERYLRIDEVRFLSCNFQECNIDKIAKRGNLALANKPPIQEIPMKFRPLHDRIVVTRIDADDKTAGGIIIPDTAKEKPSEGEVIAVGPGGRDEAGKLIPIDLKKGDRVLFGKWSGNEVKIEGVEYLIMKESDIMGVIEQVVARKKAA
jgi:chaperonin GroES